MHYKELKKQVERYALVVGKRTNKSLHALTYSLVIIMLNDFVRSQINNY